MANCFAYELSIPELRAWGLKRFPYVTFYMPRGDRIDVWRVLHTRRDIPGSLQPEPEPKRITRPPHTVGEG